VYRYSAMAPRGMSSSHQRIGNLEWSKYLDTFAFAKRIYRVLKLGDIVPHLT
jgi:hypothetical protein